MNSEDESTRSAERRRKLTESINGALADIALARERCSEVEQRHAEAMQQLRSERGTAGAELAKAHVEYRRLHAALGKLLPEPHDLDGEAEA